MREVYEVLEQWAAEASSQLVPKLRGQVETGEGRFCCSGRQEIKRLLGPARLLFH